MRCKLAVLAGILAIAIASGIGALTHEASAPAAGHAVLANGTGPKDTTG
ncbi:hypothetical protein ACWDBW_27175 [Streptomyces sp. NPDC001107]